MLCWSCSLEQEWPGSLNGLYSPAYWTCPTQYLQPTDASQQYPIFSVENWDGVRSTKKAKLKRRAPERRIFRDSKWVIASQALVNVCVLRSHDCEATLVILRNSWRETLPSSSRSTSIPSSFTSHSPSSDKWYLTNTNTCLFIADNHLKNILQ